MSLKCLDFLRKYSYLFLRLGCRWCTYVQTVVGLGWEQTQPHSFIFQNKNKKNRQRASEMMS